MDALDEAELQPDNDPGIVPVYPRLGRLLFVSVTAAMVFSCVHASLQPKIHENSIDHSLESVFLALVQYTDSSPNGLFPPAATYPDTSILDVSVLAPHQQEVMVRAFLAQDFPGLFDVKEHHAKAHELLAEEPVDWEAIARIGARNFLYVPWPTRDMNDIVAMVEAQKSLSPADMEEFLTHDRQFPIPHLRSVVFRQRDNKYGCYAAPPDNPILFIRHTKPRRDRKLTMSLLRINGRYETLVEGQTRYDLKKIAALMDGT